MTTRFPGWRHMTGAQRRNAKADAIFAVAREHGMIGLGVEHPAKITARQTAKLNGHEPPTRRLFDMASDRAACYPVNITETSAVVVYEDEPDCVVSCGNHAGRFIGR